MPPQGPYGPPAAQAAPLPQRAHARLSAMRGDGTHRGLATSDFSVNEFLLTREAGFEPLGLVMGTSIYHVGWQIMNWKQSQEVTVLSQAMYNARTFAMSRMVEEANILGADGIVGVRLEINKQDWEAELSEFVAVGTAIRARNGKSYRNAQGRPFTSALSGQDFWTLLQAGYLPA
ncbi:MAG: YbjQ family protein, partial [Chloroflexi bacterium]|nr:YbjQ family protein [Chloroflexota bacterium]